MQIFRMSMEGGRGSANENAVVTNDGRLRTNDVMFQWEQEYRFRLPLRERISRLNHLTEIEENQANSDVNCSICLEELNSTTCVALPICHHIFHKNCISMWLITSPINNCPICRVTAV
jgi:hypothetical protein